MTNSGELSLLVAQSGKFIGSLMLSIFLLLSCTWLKPAPRDHHPALQRGSGEEILALLLRQDGKIRGLRAQAEITLETAGERQWFKAALVAQKPDYLRLELFNFFGQPIQYLVASHKEVMVYVPTARQAMAAPPTGLNLYRLCGIRIELSDLVSILLGQPPWGQRMEQSVPSLIPSLSYLNSQGAYLLEVDGEQQHCKLLLDAWELWIRRLLIVRGQEQWEVAWDRFVSVGGIYLPTRLEFSIPRDKTKVIIAYDTPEVNAGLTPELFRLKLPYGVEVIQLDGSPDKGTGSL